MKSATLRGRDHTEIDAIALRYTDRVAITLSLGGHEKTYRHTDDNEDGAGFVEGDGGVFVAIADGHSGCEASEAVIAFLIEEVAPNWVGRESLQIDDWGPVFLEALVGANERVHSLVESRDRWKRRSRTTLTFALIRPIENLLAFASIGDSHLFRAARKSTADIVWQHSPSGERFFLGMPLPDAKKMAERCITGQLTLDDVQAIVLATDGLSESGIGVPFPEGVVSECAKGAAALDGPQRAQAMARAITEAATASHRKNKSGDNMASAVVWVEPWEDKPATKTKPKKEPEKKPEREPGLGFFGDAIKR